MLKQILVVVSLLILSCTSSVVIRDGFPLLNANDNTATCIILNVEGNFNEFVPIYIDRKCVAGVQDTSIATFEVEPGEHYLIAALDNQSVKKINFKAGKLYFVKMGTLEVPMFDGVRIELISKEDGLARIDSLKRRLKYVSLNPEVKFEDYDEKDYKEEMEEYKNWEKENKEDAIKLLEYEGY